jgi:hypothetical protein
MNKTLTEQRVRLLVAFAAGCLAFPASVAIGFIGAGVFDRISGRKKKRGSSYTTRYRVRREPVFEYNEAVSIYNSSLVRINESLIEMFKKDPGFKELLQKLEQEDVDAIFEDIMNKEF